MFKLHNSTTLYFIRHGQTQYNKKHIRQGTHIDDYLDTEGILEVEKLTPIIKTLDLDVLFTSYLKRSEETAAVINQRLEKQVAIMHDYRLRERDFGSLAGKTVEEWNQILPDHREKENMQIYDYSPFGGEKAEEVRKRVFGAILDIANNNDHKNIGIITHGGVIRMLLFHFPDIPRIYRAEDTNKDVANCDIYEWEMTEDRIANIQSLLK
jgi:broad specificity phosphatase PhoE